jgi:hypothetical protein
LLGSSTAYVGFTGGTGGANSLQTISNFSYATLPPVTVTSAVINGNNAALAGVQRSMVNSIAYTFSQAVTLAATNAFTIGVHSGQIGTAPTLNWAAVSPDSSGASTQWVVTFSGSGVTAGSIANGAYDITLNASSISVEGNPAAAISPRPTDTFYRLFGDINGDGAVNAADNIRFKAALTTYNAAFDSNGDGFINAADNIQFKNSQSTSFLNSGVVFTI